MPWRALRPASGRAAAARLSSSCHPACRVRACAVVQPVAAHARPSPRRATQPAAAAADDSDAAAACPPSTPARLTAGGCGYRRAPCNQRLPGTCGAFVGKICGGVAFARWCRLLA
eukprot:359062-Chlamydomonas_euryale.AAC.20